MAEDKEKQETGAPPKETPDEEGTSIENLYVTVKCLMPSSKKSSPRI